MSWLLLILAIKLVVALVLWGVGHVALIELIGLPISTQQVLGGSIVLALLCPVRIKVERSRW